MRDLAQEDIDAVYGECVMQDNVWCLAHQSRFHALAARCDDWRDFEDSVMRVVERLEEQPSMMQGKWPSVPGEATHALDAENDDPVVTHTFDEHNWPEFEVGISTNLKEPQVALRCSGCDWIKLFPLPVQWSVLTTATVRHGMGHQEEQR